MCLHETIQISQDGERTIVCGDCGREFGHIARDEKETFVVYAPEDWPVVVVTGSDGEAGLVVGTRHSQLTRKMTFPCAKCGWAMRCHLDGGDCHT